MMKGSKKVLNELFIDVFNQILILEERALAKESTLDVTMTEIHVLEAIKKCDPPTMGTVSKKLMITMGTLTTSVNRLVEKGYVTRYRNENDRRVVLLHLTEKGEEVFELHENFHEKLINAALKDLEDREDLTLALESIHRFFKKLQEQNQ